MIHKLVAELHISAPLIMSGHEPLVKGDSVRPSSIKGALRFWWRALQWPTLRGRHSSDAEALKTLHQTESRLFGAAAGESGKQSLLLLRLDAQQKLDEQVFAKEANLSKSHPGAAYLLGQGIHGAGLLSSKPIKLSLCWREGILNEEEQSGVIQAVMAFGLLGSIGARARKGFGSLSLQTLSLDGTSLPVPQNLAELKNWFNRLTKGSVRELPPFTAFGPDSKAWVLKLKSAQSPLVLLDTYGQKMKSYRESEQGHFRGERASLRALFGLPNNILSVSPKIERRASPLFAHLHRFPNGEQLMLATLMPAQFLPDGKQISINLKNSPTKNGKFEPNWFVIEGFISQCGGEELTL